MDKIDKYVIGQHNWKEVSLDHESLERLAKVESYFLDEEEQNEIQQFYEEFDMLKKELLKCLDEIIDKEMTEHQKNIIYYRFKCGMTYSEIAKIFKKNYTTVPNAILGIKSKKYGGKYHGGILKKLRKYALKDEKVQLILQKIDLLRKKELPNFHD